MSFKETGSFLYTRAGDAVQIPSERTKQPDLDIAKFLAGAVSLAEVNQLGNLTLSMESGSRLSVQPDPNFEAWTVVDPNGYRVVCMPGGEIATWEAQA